MKETKVLDSHLIELITTSNKEVLLKETDSSLYQPLFISYSKRHIEYYTQAYKKEGFHLEVWKIPRSRDNYEARVLKEEYADAKKIFPLLKARSPNLYKMSWTSLIIYLVLLTLMSYALYYVVFLIAK